MYSPLETRARAIISETYPNNSITKVDYQYNSIFHFSLDNNREGYVNVKLNRIILYLN